jgi:hypothetical protein
MTSPYLEQSFVPLSVALLQMLDKIEAKLMNEKLEAAEEERLRGRAQLIRRLLEPSPITYRVAVETWASGGGQSLEYLNTNSAFVRGSRSETVWLDK